MREIKFRAWDKSINKMHYLPNMGICYEYSHLSFEANSGDLDGICQWPEGDDSYIEGQIIMQFTGLKDKNGKEIYEGDIVAGYKGDFVHNVIGVVKYCGLSFVFEGTTEENRYDISGGKGDNYWRYTVTNPSVKELPEIEVIGNIYENSELLKT